MAEPINAGSLCYNTSLDVIKQLHMMVESNSASVSERDLSDSENGVALITEKKYVQDELYMLKFTYYWLLVCVLYTTLITIHFT